MYEYKLDMSVLQISMEIQALKFLLFKILNPKLSLNGLRSAQQEHAKLFNFHKKIRTWNYFISFKFLCKPQQLFTLALAGQICKPIGGRISFGTTELIFQARLKIK